MKTLKIWNKPSIDSVTVRSAQSAGSKGASDGGTVTGKKHVS